MEEERPAKRQKGLKGPRSVRLRHLLLRCAEPGKALPEDPMARRRKVQHVRASDRIFLWVMDGFGTVFKYWNLDDVLYLTSNLWSKQWTIVERESDTGPSVLLTRCSYCFWIADASPWPRLTSRGRKWTDSLVAAAFVCRAWPGRLDDQKEITM